MEGDTLVDRLRGKYAIPVDDGAGLLDGKSTFTRQFQTSPIDHEAADRIEQLERELSALRNECHDAAERDEGCFRAVKAERELAEARGAMDYLLISTAPDGQWADQAVHNFVRALKSPAQGATIILKEADR